MSTGTSTADPAAGRAASEPRTAFVLAGGAALGAMQARMIHSLYERGIVPDLLIGASAGALNAAFLASGPPPLPPRENWPPSGAGYGAARSSRCARRRSSAAWPGGATT
jgi:hypothetical protein